MPRPKVEYKCICGYTTNKKSHYVNHKNRKTPCIIIDNNKTDINNKNNEELLLIIKKLNNEKNKLLIKLDDKDSIIEQERLSKIDLITTNKGLMKNNQILIKDANSLRESIKINMTMNNYFVINSYGKEDTSYIDMNKLMNDYKSLAQMVAKQIQLKHFSKQKKNHNLMLMRTIAKTYNDEEGIWEPKDNVKLFIVNELIKKGVVNIDDYKTSKNIKFESTKEKKYKKDKKYLSLNIPLPCMFNPTEAKKRFKEIKEQRESDIDPMDLQWDNIENKYKREIKSAKKQLEVKTHLIEHLNKSIKDKNIKAGMVKFKNY